MINGYQVIQITGGISDGSNYLNASNPKSNNNGSVSISSSPVTFYLLAYTGQQFITLPYSSSNFSYIFSISANNYTYNLAIKEQKKKKRHVVWGIVLLPNIM